MTRIEWYYSKHDQPMGPVSTVELKQFAKQGELGEDDLVWREGMDEWLPAGKIKGLLNHSGEPEPTAIHAPPPPTTAPVITPVVTPVSTPVSTAQPASPAVFERSASVFEAARPPVGRHFLDAGLELLRRGLNPHFVESTAEIFRLLGHWGMYAAMAAGGVVGLLTAMVGGGPAAIVAGLVAVVVLGFLQYLAMRLLEVLDRFNRAAPHRVASSVFFDTIALTAALAGLAVLLSLAMTGLVSGQFPLVLAAVGGFIICQYTAVLALNPATLNITVSAETPPAAEALGVLAFFAKLPARIAPVGYGAGAALGTMEIVRAVVRLWETDEVANVLQLAEVQVGFAVVVTAAMLPLAGYLVFLLGHLLLELAGCMLSLRDEQDIIDSRKSSTR